MQTESINLNVPSEIAAAFRKASPETQALASEKAWEVLRYALMSREDTVREFERIANAMSDTAQESGLTEEMLQDLLNEGDAE